MGRTQAFQASVQEYQTRIGVVVGHWQYANTTFLKTQVLELQRFLFKELTMPRRVFTSIRIFDKRTMR
jgi:hypothetical protein